MTLRRWRLSAVANRGALSASCGYRTGGPYVSAQAAASHDERRDAALDLRRLQCSVRWSSTRCVRLGCLHRGSPLARALAAISVYGRILRTATGTAHIVSAQTGPMVMTKGRIVSLAELELRSKAWNTSTVPSSRTASASTTPPTDDHLMLRPTSIGERRLRNFSGGSSRSRLR